MEKLDRLGWAAGESFLAYGVRIGIRASTPEALEAAAGVLPPGSRPDPGSEVDVLYSVRLGGQPGRAGTRPFNLVYAGPARIARSLDLETALDALEQHVALAVAELAPRHVFVHAGVVGWRGRAILLPGRTFTGKSTLTEALLRAGANYYSDEYAVLDERGRVHPYPRPLSLRQGEGERPARLVPETSGTGPLPVGLVAVAEYREGARWRPRRLTPGQGVLALLANAVPARRRPEASLAALRQVTAAAPVLKGARGEAAETAVLLLERLDSTGELTG